MFELLEKAVKMTANVATLPVSVAVDIATLGGALSDKEESYTVSKGKRIIEDAKDIVDEIAS